MDLFIRRTTSTGNTIAISDPDYFMPAVRITPYTEDSYANVTPHSQFTLDVTGFL